MYFLLDRISRDGWQARVSIEHERNCECSVDIISANFCVVLFRHSGGRNGCEDRGGKMRHCIKGVDEYVQIKTNETDRFDQAKKGEHQLEYIRSDSGFADIIVNTKLTKQ